MAASNPGLLHPTADECGHRTLIPRYGILNSAVDIVSWRYNCGSR
jgi:hypothetical protein